MFAIMLFCRQRALTDRNSRLVGEVLGIIEREYVEPVKGKDLFEGAVYGMLDTIGDRYSGFIPPREEQEYYEELDNEFVGVGIEVATDPVTGRIFVRCPLLGSPAHSAGIRCDDVILRIDGTSTQDLTTEEVSALIRGERGTIVTFTVLHQGETDPVDIDIVRDLVKVDTVRGYTRDSEGRWIFRLTDNPRIGYVQVTSFDGATPGDLRRVLITLIKEGLDGLVLDLRDNPGGLLYSAQEVCDLFISKGDIVTTRDRNGRVVRRLVATRGGTLPNFPLAILVNQRSASGSEIVAACLQDHRRAVIIGSRTWGKGTVQELIELAGDHGTLKLTTASYWRPLGANIHRTSEAKDDDVWGVTPDEGYALKLDKKEERERNNWQFELARPRRLGSTPPTAADDVFVDRQLNLAVGYVDSFKKPKEKTSE